jgi:hypothetical protein
MLTQTHWFRSSCRAWLPAGNDARRREGPFEHVDGLRQGGEL